MNKNVRANGHLHDDVVVAEGGGRDRFLMTPLPVNHTVGKWCNIDRYDSRTSRNLSLVQLSSSTKQTDIPTDIPTELRDYGLYSRYS